MTALEHPQCAPVMQNTAGVETCPNVLAGHRLRGFPSFTNSSFTLLPLCVVDFRLVFSVERTREMPKMDQTDVLEKGAVG